MAEGNTKGGAGEDLGFDPDDLLKRYRAERDKRLRQDKNAQFVDVEAGGAFAHFLHDPYVEPGFTRPPLDDEVEVLIVGGGYSGLLVGARLRQAGVDDFRIIERGGDFGGAWYWNRYPGIACDVESYVYLPMLEEVGTMPSRKYAPGEEIFQHCRALARKFDLYRDVCFQTTVTEARWDEAAERWFVRTDRGDVIRARFYVVANMASLDKPKLPGVPGVETFRGHTFHTSRWDYAYTGGDAEGGLTGLNGKRVGIIGTGATAVQCIPHLAEAAEHLYVFQRTPSSVDARNDRLTDPKWVKTLEPGWQDRRIDNFTQLTGGGHAEEDLVNDGWTELARSVNTMFSQRRLAPGETAADPARLVQLVDLAKMERIRARVDDIVQNKAWAEALKPWYNQFCKRPCFHDGYLETFNRPNVSLVDTGGHGVERVTEAGVVVAGQEYPLDCLVFATGFEVGRKFDRRIGYPIYGRAGRQLAEKWENGAATLHGLFSRGFPNSFVISIVQSAFAFNFLHTINELSRHIAYVIGEARAEGVKVFEPSQAAEDAWVAEIERAAPQREAFLRDCTPGYYNYEGDLSILNTRNGPYGAGPIAYFRTLRDWREAGDMPGLERTPG
jgi:cyclohexanone monooxygenase